MSRVTRFKIYYAVGIGTAIAVGLLLVDAYDARPRLLLLFAVALLVPGRIQGFFYRDFFTGRRLMDSGGATEALVHFERFRTTLRAAPWRRHLLWLQFSVYTLSAEAMTLNNIGAAQLTLGHLDEAERSFNAAIAIDRQYPLPFFNLAVLHSVRNRRDLAARHADEATRLGFAGSTMDAVLNRAQSMLARVEGRVS